MDRLRLDSVTVATAATGRLLRCRRRDGGRICVDMGAPGLLPDDIPVATTTATATTADTNAVVVPPVFTEVGPACCVSMGNPHTVFFVEDADAVDVAAVGPVVERHPMFPSCTNVEFVSVSPAGSLRMVVWERGAGVTPACGSGACAAVVAAVRRSLLPRGRGADVVLDGGTLHVEWREEDGHVLMTGPAVTAFTGSVVLDRDD